MDLAPCVVKSDDVESFELDRSGCLAYISLASRHPLQQDNAFRGENAGLAATDDVQVYYRGLAGPQHVVRGRSGPAQSWFC